VTLKGGTRWVHFFLQYVRILFDKSYQIWHGNPREGGARACFQEISHTKIAFYYANASHLR